jgi:hypothetical protein
MTAAEFVALLQEAIDVHGDPGEYFEDIDSARDYDENGILTYNKGLVVRMASGDEFQVTVVQSAFGDNDDDDQEEGSDG